MKSKHKTKAVKQAKKIRDLTGKAVTDDQAKQVQGGFRKAGGEQEPYSMLPGAGGGIGKI